MTSGPSASWFGNGANGYGVLYREIKDCPCRQYMTYGEGGKARAEECQGRVEVDSVAL